MRATSQQTRFPIHGWRLMVSLALTACEPDLVAPVVQTPVPATMTLVSGNDQEGMAGKFLDQPLRVRVATDEGLPLRLAVSWSVTEGQGRFRWQGIGGVVYGDNRAQTPGTADGVVGVEFVPLTLGRTTVTAMAPGTAPVTFTVTAIGVAILYWGGWGWFGPTDYGDVVVPVGTLVEWDAQYQYEWGEQCTPLRIRSTEAPGGASFDSGPLDATSGVFQFVPQVGGTWKYDVDYDCDYVDHLALVAQ